MTHPILDSLNFRIICLRGRVKKSIDEKVLRG
jgi:hypothetical protein